MISSDVNGGVTRQCAAGGGGCGVDEEEGEDFIGSSSDSPGMGILFESPERNQMNERRMKNVLLVSSSSRLLDFFVELFNDGANLYFLIQTSQRQSPR